MSTLLNFQLFSCRFLANETSIVPPFAPHTKMPTYGETPSTMHTPNHAIRATTHASAYTPPPRYIDTTYRYQFAPWPRTEVRQLHRGRPDLPYDAGGASSGRRDAVRYMFCWCGVAWDVEGGRVLPARRRSYRGHKVELLRIADWLKNDKNKQSRQLGRAWVLSGKNRHNAF